MIVKVIKAIQVYLENSVETLHGNVHLAALEKESVQNEGGVMLSLLHIEEETSIKPQMPLASGELRYKNPDLLLNLYVLISAQDSEYETALHNISSVISALQKQNVIQEESTGHEYRLSLNQMSLEQSFNMWQTLGSKMMPSVVYKVRMLKVQSSDQKPYGKVEKVVSTFDHTNAPSYRETTHGPDVLVTDEEYLEKQGKKKTHNE